MKRDEKALVWLELALLILEKKFRQYGMDWPVGADPEAWRRFSMNLLTEYEPGFGLPGKAGAPRKTSTLERDAIILFELGPGRKGNFSISAAARHLAKTPGFSGASHDYIRKRFYHLRNRKTPEHHRLVEFLKAAIEDEEKNL